VFCSVAPGLLRDRTTGAAPRLGVVEAIALLFAMFTVDGCDPQPVLDGLVLLLLGIPVYVLQ
jgi:arginine:agmatine antiporter